jgi:GYF domain 2
MSDSDLVQAKPRFLARSPTPLFLLLCLLLSSVGSVATFFVFAIVIAIFDAALAREVGPYEPVALAVATILGFIFPLVVLTRKRRAARRQSRTADTQQPLSIVIGDGAGTPAPGRNDARTGLPYQASPSPPPLDQDAFDLVPGQPREAALPSSHMPAYSAEKVADQPAVPLSDGQSVNEAAAESVWFYTDHGGQKGPISTAKLKRLIATNQIGKDTHVWRNGLKQWMPIHETELVEGVGNVAPPIPTQFISNSIVWLVAFGPLIFAVIDQEIKQNQISNALSTGDVRHLLVAGPVGLPFYVQTIVYSILCLVDAIRIERAGYSSGYMRPLAFFIVPIYLFVRASKLRQTPYYGFVFILFLVLSAILT